jgi:hypothetical protein
VGRGKRYLAGMRLEPSLSRVAVGAVLAVATAACGGAKPAPVPAPTPAAEATPAPATPTAAPVPPPALPSPLALFAGRKVAVFPLQRIAAGDSAAQPVSAAAVRPRAATFDSAFTKVLEERGLGSQWVLPPAMLRAAQREVVNRTDARALAVQGLGPQRRPNDLEVREPLASQLRTLIALTDARWVLVPVEVRLSPVTDGRRTAKVRLAMIDGRGGQVVALPEATGAPAADEAGALAALATAIADLIVAP